MEKQEELMLSRRQKTLSSISNYLPLHIVLNRPAGVSFSITVPKSFSVEQLARQIEAEYAFLVEREVGYSKYPVIECGALFDHVDLELDRASIRRRRTRPTQKLPAKEGGSAKGMSTVNEEDQPLEEKESEDQDEDEVQSEDDNESVVDEREEAESRGVQLRFSDKVDDILDRNSTVHVVNIDQGIGMGRKLSLSNLALAVSQDAVLADILPANSTTAMSLSSPPFHAGDADRPSTPPQTIAHGAPPLTDGQQLFPNAGGTTSADGQRSDPRVSTLTTDSSMTFIASPFASSSSLSPILHGESHVQQPGSSALGALAPAPGSISESLHPTSRCSTPGEGTSTEKYDKGNNRNDTGSSRPSFAHPRSRATDILLNLEASSNDTRFQGILHNTIALDHFRQFCFQEYSIENLLFWMDVELFANPSQERLQMGHHYRRGGRTGEAAQDDEADSKEEEASPQMNAEQFAIQQARYIYLTYIDSCAPLQVNLSDESRTDIPWPIMDYKHTAATSLEPSSAPSSPQSEKKGGFLRMSSNGRDQKKREEDVVGWPLDRHMFDGAQEHTYQLMKGHTLVRFEESDLWKAVQKIMREHPEEYAKATIQSPLSSHYVPDKSVIFTTVARSRSRHPSAKPQTLYNWNNSTSDLDRSHDKEEALAKTMSQYFGPIPGSIRHPTHVILGLGRLGDDHFEDGFEHFDTYDSRNRDGIHDSKRSSTSSVGMKTNIFRKRLGGGIIRRSKSHSSEEILDLCHDDYENDLAEIDSVENGRRTTRWMVAGYFNDQVRLTAAQRKRLLRRNNKLTKFFGSRVDGILRPAEDPVDKGDGLVESSSAPSSGSPLAYALSSSMIHDMDRKGITKKKSSSSEWNKAKRSIKGYGTGSGSEALLLLPGTKPVGSKSANLLQKFRRNLPELEVENGNGNSGHVALDFPGSSKGSLFKKANGNKDGGSRHHRSMTATDAQCNRRILAHPHPLWSGSLSDQEGSSSAANERRRKLSVLSIAANSTRNAPGGLTPTTPTSLMVELYGLSKGAVDTSGASLDRHAMTSRRKKADKLSTFFGAQLTTLELSTQLPMGHEDEATEVRGSNGKFNESSSEAQRVSGPTVSSVNKLSNKERTTLWKRNKKLRGLLGESLPESAVALALTNPLLMDSSPSKLRGAGGRRASDASKLQRRGRRGSSQSLHGSLQGGYEGEDTERSQQERDGNGDEDEYEDEASVDGEDDTILISSVAGKSSSASKGRGKVATRSSSTRHRRLSVVSTSSRGYSRTGRNRNPGMIRPLSSYSLESLLTIDSLVSSALRDYKHDDDDSEDYIRYSTDKQSSPRRRKSSVRPLDLASLSVKTHGVDSASGSKSPSGLSRFNHKKKMDKIHQFLGDRVPEQDLWMGTVGRQKTQEMVDLHLLSSTSSAGGGPLSPSAFDKHGFPRRNGKGDKFGDRAAEGRLAGYAPAKMPGGVRLERSLSDPPIRSFGHLKLDGQHQHLTITNRLRQQLTSTLSPSTFEAGGISGLDQVLSSNAYSSPATSSPGSPPSSATGPRSGTTPAISGLTSLVFVQEGDDDEDNAILPRLRAMSDKDQERFLKRAGKLEKYFGKFPPSALLETSLTTFPLASGSKGNSSFTKGASVDTEEGSRWAKHRQLSVPAARLLDVDHDFSDGGSKASGKGKGTARTSEDAIGSASVSETRGV